LSAIYAYMRPAKAMDEEYGRTYAFVNLFDLPRSAHNYQYMR